MIWQLGCTPSQAQQTPCKKKLSPITGHCITRPTNIIQGALLKVHDEVEVSECPLCPRRNKYLRLLRQQHRTQPPGVRLDAELGLAAAEMLQ